MADLTIQLGVKKTLNDQYVLSDFYDELEIEELLEDAAQRATDNDRKTVQARDL